MISLLKRQCGECKACCTAVGVNELGKPCNFECEHETDKGCGIYGKHPQSCKEYQCGWLEGILPYECRPDKFGIVLHCHEEKGFWLDGHLLPIAANNMERIIKLCYALLKEMPSIRGVRLIGPDQIMNVDYKINIHQYPGGENDGTEGTVWESNDDKIYLLKAPARIALKVL